MAAIDPDRCPRCEKSNLKYQHSPARHIETETQTPYQKGDFIEVRCGTPGCGWHSRQTYTGRGWVFETPSLLGDRKRGLTNL